MHAAHMRRAPYGLFHPQMEGPMQCPYKQARKHFQGHNARETRAQQPKQSCTRGS